MESSLKLEPHLSLNFFFPSGYGPGQGKNLIYFQSRSQLVIGIKSGRTASCRVQLSAVPASELIFVVSSSSLPSSVSACSAVTKMCKIDLPVFVFSRLSFGVMLCPWYEICLLYPLHWWAHKFAHCHCWDRRAGERPQVYIWVEGRVCCNLPPSLCSYFSVSITKYKYLCKYKYMLKYWHDAD